MWPFVTRKAVQQELHASEQRILSQLATVDELVTQLKKELIPDQQPQPGELRLQQLPREVAYLRQHVSIQQHLLQEIHTMLSQISLVTPTGQKKPHHQDIKDRIILAMNAIESVGQIYTVGMDGYAQRLEQVTALMREEADRHNQGQSSVEALIVEMKPPSDGVAAD